MRKLLFESLFRRPLTEQAPSPGRRRRGGTLQPPLGQCRAAAARPEPFDPRDRCRILQRMRAGNSRAQQRLLRRRALRPPVRRLAAPCRCPDGDRTGDQKHARGAGAHLSRDARTRNGWSRSEIAHGTEDVSPAATRSSAASPRSSRSTSTFPAARLPPRPCCRIAGAARTRGRGRRYVVRNAIEPVPAPASVGGRSCSLSWGLSWDL